MTAPGLTVIVPLYDEAEGVPALAERLRAFVAAQRPRPVDIVLVDDGSTDDTRALLERHASDLPGTIRQHGQNRGLTAALYTGLEAAQGELVGWLDSDLTYDPDILGELATALATHEADLALASCYHPDGRVEGVAGWRRALSAVASGLYRRLTGAPLHTFTSMVRVHRREVLEQCRPHHPGFLGVTEALLRALERGYRVVEVPAILRRRRRGQSKMRVLRVGFGHLGLMALARRARRALGRASEPAGAAADPRRS